MRKVGMDADGNHLFDGVPTDGDVQRLMDAFGIPEEGWEVSYQDVGMVFGASYGTLRWFTVTNVWRKRLLTQHNVCLAPHPEKRDRTLLALNPAQRLQRGWRGVRGGVRKVRRSHVLVVKTDRERLPEKERAVYDHLVDRSARVLLANRQAVFAPRPPKAIGEGK